MLAAIALSVATGILIKGGRARYALVTLVPLAWLALISTVAAWEKVVSADARVGLFTAADTLAGALVAGTLTPARAAVVLQRQGVRAGLRVYPGRGHGSTVASFALIAGRSTPAVSDTTAFIKSVTPARKPPAPTACSDPRERCGNTRSQAPLRTGPR